MLLAARRLFDGRTPTIRDAQVIEVEDGSIVAVRPRREADDDSDLTDLGDATLMPGLVDIHQHLCFDASADPVAQVQADDDRALVDRIERHARRALVAGITTVRDLGDRGYLTLGVRDRIASGELLGPRILAAGPPITSRRGHCWFLGGETDGGADQVRQAAAERAARGVDVVKLMASGGNLTPTVGPHESQFGFAEIVAAREEAHVHGLRLAVHAHGRQAIADALEAGADSIEHCTFFSADGVDADLPMLERLARSGAVISATAATLPGVETPIPAMVPRIKAIIENIATLHQLGARIVLSSDAGIAVTKAHDVLPHVVPMAVQRLGMSPFEALQAVTSHAGEACGMGELTGVLEPGMAADVIAVAGDPLVDPAAVNRVVAVMARGVLLDPEAMRGSD